MIKNAIAIKERPRQIMHLLHLIASVDPRGGGPIEGLMRNAQTLNSMGHQVTVVSLDEPDSVAARLEFPFTFIPLGPSFGKYGYCPRLVPWLKQNAHKYDIVIVQGIWQYHSFGTWRALRNSKVPYLVFTHGMLDPWFKRRYPFKHLKKWLYWPWGEYRVLRDARAVLFTTEEERILAARSFGLYKANERVVPYGTAGAEGDSLAQKAAFESACPDIADRPYFLFLGRIHQKKGCDDLVKAFATVAGEVPEFRLVMAGPDDVGWAADLKKMATKLGVADKIIWPGMLKGDAKWGAFRNAQAFVLPSHQENFGIAVAEALSASSPVIISRQVNIWREIESDGAGIVDDDTAQGCEAALRTFLKMSPEAVAEMRRRGKQCFDKRFEIHNMSNSLIQIIEELG